MPNTKSAIRRVRRVKKQTQINRIRKSKYRSALKEMNDLIEKKDNSKIKNFLPKFQSILMQVAKTGTINKKTAAVVIELVQGEAGIIKAKKPFIARIKKLCKENNALIIIDEVQSGVGRTGTLFAYEQFNIKPDIVTSAKGLGNGFPIGAILTKNHIAESMQVGTHGTTYGGNPLACSIALDVINTISKKRLLANVKKKEKIFIKKLNMINANLKCFERINTAGLWIGCKLNVTDSVNLDTVLQQCYKNGLMVLKANNNTIRIAPSLIIEDKLINSGLDILEKSIAQLQKA